MGKTVVVTQSNYIPWRGYFDMIAQADELILLDDVQYTRRDWRNRNLIRTATESRWLTIPVEVAGLGPVSIDSVRIAEPGWAEEHVQAIAHNYRSAAAYDAVSPWLFRTLDEAAALPMLSQVNRLLLERVSEQLGITTPIQRSVDLIDRGALGAMTASERLARLAEACGADRYLTGPAAQAYLDVAAFESRGITVAWMDYAGYRDYPQCWPGFEPKVSIIDLLLNMGEEAAAYVGR